MCGGKEGGDLGEICFLGEVVFLLALEPLSKFQVFS